MSLLMLEFGREVFISIRLKMESDFIKKKTHYPDFCSQEGRREVSTGPWNYQSKRHGTRINVPSRSFLDEKFKKVTILTSNHLIERVPVSSITMSVLNLGPPDLHLS